jgi:pterin-4a-carbinolamine dehydratase
MQQIVNSAVALTASFPTRKKLSARDFEELKPERVQEMLTAMPGWKLDMNRRAIDRFHEFPDSKVALAFATYATELAGAGRQPISVLVSAGRVGLTLHGQQRRGKRGGLTMAVLELAKRLG